MADATKGMATKDIGDSPSEFLQQLKGQPVVVKLNSGVDYRGALLDCGCPAVSSTHLQAARTGTSLETWFKGLQAHMTSPGRLALGHGAALGAPFRQVAVRAGILACLDGYMNIAMEQTEEYVEGQLKNRYGDCFIRGNNGARLPLLASC